MNERWTKTLTAFRARRQKMKNKIYQSRPIQWLVKQGWFNWIVSQKVSIIAILAIFAFAGYAFLIRNELTVGENQGNIKFVAIKSKDTQSNGYKQNIRSNLTINGSIPDKEAFLRKEWGEYGGGIPILSISLMQQRRKTKHWKSRMMAQLKACNLNTVVMILAGFFKFTWMMSSIHKSTHTMARSWFTNPSP